MTLFCILFILDDEGLHVLFLWFVDVLCDAGVPRHSTSLTLSSLLQAAGCDRWASVWATGSEQADSADLSSRLSLS